MAGALAGSTTGRLGANGQATTKQAVVAGAVEPEALAFTHWFDSGEEGKPYSATIRFTGRRVGVRNPTPRDSFVQDETIDRVSPGTGPISISTWVYGLRPGEWTVSAELIRVSSTTGGVVPPARSRPVGARPVRPAAWSWLRWAVSTAPASPVKTRWALLAPLARRPAVIPGLYTALAVIGALVGLTTQGAILASEDVRVSSVLGVSVLAVVSGLIAAKVWYAVLHPGESVIKGGWAADGILIVTPLVGVAALFAFRLPIAVVVDASAPGLFFALAIGRIGCFFAGCCSGRCTDSRWGVWSSDSRVGARRIPAQFVESGTSWVIGIASLLLVLGDVVPVRGAVFVVAFAAYAVARQFLLRLRAERRKSPRTLPLTAAAAAVVLLVVAVLSLLQAT